MRTDVGSANRDVLIHLYRHCVGTVWDRAGIQHRVSEYLRTIDAGEFNVRAGSEMEAREHLVALAAIATCIVADLDTRPSVRAAMENPAGPCPVCHHAICCDGCPSRRCRDNPCSVCRPEGESR